MFHSLTLKLSLFPPQCSQATIGLIRTLLRRALLVAASGFFTLSGTSLAHAGGASPGDTYDMAPSTYDVTKMQESIDLVKEMDPVRGGQLQDLYDDGNLWFLSRKASESGHTSKPIAAVKVKGKSVLTIAAVLCHELLHLNGTDVTYNAGTGADTVCDLPEPTIADGLAKHAEYHEETLDDNCFMSCLLAVEGKITDCKDVMETLVSALQYYTEAFDVVEESYPLIAAN